MATFHKVIAEVTIVANSQEEAARMVYDKLKPHCPHDLKVHRPKRGHEITVREEPTREQLADWTEPW